jgi:phage repressor protein C with HTH and peptisase S24 domain
VVSSVDDALGRPKNTSTILEIDVRAGAGGGGTSVEAYVIDGNGNTYSAEGVKDQWQLPDTIMRQELHASPAHIRIFEVIGDSMLPVLHERDRVFIDTRLKAPAPEGIFALWDGQGLVIKRLQMINPSDPLRVRIISANKASYDPYEMPLSEIQIIGRFAGKFTTQLAG